MSDNGNEPEKTQEQAEEQILAERLERYQKEPNSFIELSDIVCLAVRNPKSQLGVSVLTGNVSRALLDIGQVELNHLIQKVRMQMDIQSEMKRQAEKKIAQPGAMHRFANKIIGK